MILPSDFVDINDRTSLKRLITAFLILLTLAVFLQVRGFEFLIYDDPILVTENVHVKHGFTWEGILWSFSSGALIHGHTFDYWHPVTYLSHMLDVELFGMNPAWHHLMNLFFHVMNVILLFGFLTRLTRAPWRSAFVAAVFAVHPLQISSVVWISERKDVMSVFFALLAFQSYQFYVMQKSRTRFLSVWFFVLLSLMSKPLLVGAPFILLMMDVWPLERFKSQKAWALFWEKWPFWLLSAFICILTVLHSSPHFLTPVYAAPVYFLLYLWNLFFPPYIPIYPWQVSTYAAWITFAAFAALGSLCLIAFQAKRKYPTIFFGWYWYLFTLAPMIFLKFENRYTYLPMVGIAMIFVWRIAQIIQPVKRQKLIGFILFLVCVIPLAIRTHSEAAVWRNNQTLFETTLSFSPGVNQIHYLYATDLAQKKKIDEALPHYLAVMKSVPDAKTYDALTERLLNYLDADDIDERIAFFERAVRIKPDYTAGYQGLCDLYTGRNATDKADHFCGIAENPADSRG